MRSIRMTAKRAGTCTNCRKPITTGQAIYWQRGAGAHHVDCRGAEAAQHNSDLHAGRIVAGPCWTCHDAAGYFRQEGAATPVRCDACQAIVADARKELDRQERDYFNVDRQYEDDCARRCGL